MSGNLDGSVNQFIKLSAGAATAVSTGAFTIAVLFRPSNANCALVSLANSSNTEVRAFLTDAGHLFGANDFTAGYGTLTTGTWYVAAISKPAGAAHYRYHLWTYAADGTGTMSHGETTSAANQSDSGTSVDAIKIGGAESGSRGAGDIALVALWDRALTDAQLDTLKTSSIKPWAAMSGGAPKELISLAGWDGVNATSTVVGSSTFTSLTGTVTRGGNTTGFGFSNTAPNALVIAGFKHGTTIGLTNGNIGVKYCDATNGTIGTDVRISSGGGRNGGHCLRLTGSGRVGWTTSSIGSSQAVLAGTFWAKWDSGQAAGKGLAYVSTAAAADAAGFSVNSSGQLVAYLAASATTVTGPTLAADTWHQIDYKVDVSTGTHTLDWKVNGVAQTQVTRSVTASSIDSAYLGAPSGTVSDVLYEDLVLSRVPADYPMGGHRVVLLKADTGGTTTEIGTANATARYTSNGSGLDTTHNSANILAAISEVPPTIGSTASGVYQRTSGAGNAIGIPMTTDTIGSGEYLSGVRVEIVGWSASSTGNLIELRAYDGLLETVLQSSVNPNFGNSTTDAGWMCKIYQPGLWTQTQLNALVVRYGYSTDVSPQPGAHAVYAEAAIYTPPSTSHSGTGALSGSGAIAGAGKKGGVGTGALSGTGALAGTRRKGGIGTAAISGVGTLAAAGRRQGTAALAGAGAYAAVGRHTAQGASSLSGTGALAAVGHHAIAIAVGLSGAGAFAGAGRHAGSGSGGGGQVGVGSLAAIGSKQVQGTAALAGTGTLAGTRRKGGIGNAALAGTGTLAGTRRKGGIGIAALSGVGAMAASGIRRGSAPLTGSGAFTSAGRKNAHGVSSISGSGDLAGQGTNGIGGVGSLSATGAVSGTGSKGGRGIAALAGACTLAGTGRKAGRGASALSGLGALAGSGIDSSGGAGIGPLTGTGIITGLGRKNAHGAAALAGACTLAGTRRKGGRGTSTLAGHGAFASGGTGSESEIHAAAHWVTMTGTPASIGRTA